MFTGLISRTGSFQGFRLGGRELAIEAPEALASKLRLGDSLAVNGVCLTVASAGEGRLTFDVSRETLDRTTLGSLRRGAVLNLEPPLTLSDPLGGHFVSGHVDTVGKVIAITRRPPGRRLKISAGPEAGPFIVEKGSIAVNGVSLTVAAADKGSFEVELIPLTLEGTNLAGLKSGDRVNLEYDMLGKYVYNYLTQQHKD